MSNDIMQMADVTKNDLKIISRLVLQKILSSDAVKYLRKSGFEACHSALLSEKPEEERNLTFQIDPSVSAYGSSVMELSVKWHHATDHEVVDLEGNAWITARLVVHATLSSMYSVQFDQFHKRFEVINAVHELANELNEMVQTPVRVLHLDNASRIVRDEMRARDAAVNYMKNLFTSSDCRGHRVGLRTGGRGRTFNRSLMLDIKSGNYEFSINEGSSRRPRLKTYSVRIPENSAQLCLIKRIS